LAKVAAGLDIQGLVVTIDSMLPQASLQDIEEAREALFQRLLVATQRMVVASQFQPLQDAWQRLVLSEPLVSDSTKTRWLVRHLHVGWSPVVNQLLNWGADPNADAGNGMTCVQWHMATGGGLQEDLSDCAWQNAGAHWGDRTEDGRCLMALTLESRSLPVVLLHTVEQLLKRMPTVDWASENGEGERLVERMTQTIGGAARWVHPKAAAGAQTVMHTLAVAQEALVLHDALKEHAASAGRSKPRV
jgi:hypothetical protein